MTAATPMPDAFVPGLEWQEPDGARRLCLDFKYDEASMPIDKWPLALSYKGQTYLRTGYNSDTHTVHYKQGEVATPA